MTRLRLALRAIAASGSVVSLRSTRTCCRETRLILSLALRANAAASFKIVPDNFVESLSSAHSKKSPLGRHFTLVGRAGWLGFASPFGPSPQAAPLSHCVRPEPAAGSNRWVRRI